MLAVNRLRESKYTHGAGQLFSPCIDCGYAHPRDEFGNPNEKRIIIKPLPETYGLINQYFIL